MLRPRTKGIFFSQLTSNSCRVAVVLLCSAVPAFSEPEKNQSHVVFREEVSVEHRLRVANELRKITGWPRLGFTSKGALQVDAGEPAGGSQTARNLIAKVIRGPNFIVLEDASNRTDVVFCRVISGKWKSDNLDRPTAFVVLIDFADFDQIMGDRKALEAFNVGWGLLHELDHVATDSTDAEGLGETGECETRINQMRRECGLPERAEYFFTLFPLSGRSDFKSRFVRLPFVEHVSFKKKKYYWLIWDADLVGGIDKKERIASLR